MSEPEIKERCEPNEWIVDGNGTVVCQRLGIRVTPTLNVGFNRPPRDPNDLCAALNRVYARQRP